MSRSGNALNLSNTGKSDHSFNKLRTQLRELAVRWMDILETKNVSRNVDIDLDMRFKFNNESLDLFSGSTEIRLVLLSMPPFLKRIFRNLPVLSDF
ncbi:hypothetical protein W822_12450 [Advenella kashmirensis W13003]|uniref:Uncharacterized protein n=1 Tax=Advenella kashmirensis W13003 TaxID=1424334 RepID=V8QSN3_9BURK|nr:hypothetical protein W822_12450 [Advenella kashmirensis W13003]